MAQGMLSSLRRFLSPPTSIRRRLCWLLGGVGLSMLLAINLLWLPGAIRDIRETQALSGGHATQALLGSSRNY